MFARIVALLLGIVGTVLGLLLIGVGLFGAIGGDKTPEAFLTSVSAASSGVLLLELGLAAAWLGWQASRGGAAGPVALPPWWASALAFAVAVVAGWGALKLGWWWLFLPFATLAVFAPVAMTGRFGLPAGGARPSVARLLPAFAWGAIVTPLLAIVVELIAAVMAIVAAVVGFMLRGQPYLDIVTDTWRHLQGRTLTDVQTEALLRLAVRQPIVLVVGAFVLVFAGPVTEELSKFGATLLFSRTRPDRPGRDSTLTVFLIGLAAGLGFAVTENIFYAAQAGAGGWTALILTRAVTPLMHGTASALFALGWAQQRRAPQSWSLLRGALLALGLHMAWNLCGGLLLVAALFTSTRGTAAGVAVLLILMSLATLAGLGVASLATLLRLRRTLAEEAAEAQGGAPTEVAPSPGMWEGPPARAIAAPDG
jgi:RsiW-degrading membrane proteinase PrsW (M82 family)